MSVGEGWFGLFYTPVSSYRFYGLAVFLHFTSTAPSIGGTFGIQSNIYGGALLWK